jgi:cell division protein FtsL
MAYLDNAAYQYEAQEERVSRRNLRVHEGGRKNNESTERELNIKPLVRMVALVAVVVVALSAVRVTLSAATVSSLSTLSEIESDVDEARDRRANLRVERSVATSVDRIKRIATENYGMEFATTSETIHVDLGQSEEAPTDADVQ